MTSTCRATSPPGRSSPRSKRGRPKTTQSFWGGLAIVCGGVKTPRPTAMCVLSQSIFPSRSGSTFCGGMGHPALQLCACCLKAFFRFEAAPHSAAGWGIPPYCTVFIRLKSIPRWPAAALRPRWQCGRGRRSAHPEGRQCRVRAPAHRRSAPRMRPRRRCPPP